MSAPIEMRRLGPADVAMVAELNSMFGTAFGEPAVYVDARPGADYLRGVLAKDHVIGLVALADGVVVGGLVAYELEKLERARSEIYIYDLAVAETFRRRGIATALIRRVQEIARARGAWVVYVQADHGDDAAQALYGKLGAREDVLHFDIPV